MTEATLLRGLSTSVLAGLAAAALGAVVTVAVLLDRPESPPGLTTPPVPDGNGTVSTAPGWAVATDGADVFLLRSGERDALLVDRIDEAEARFVAVAPRPGSSVGNLTVVVLEEGEGMFALRWFVWNGGDPVDAVPLSDRYQVRDTRIDGAVPSPVWSPDGGHLAWLEGGSGGPFSVRAIQWGEGPGSDDDRNDDAAWAVDVELSPGARLQEWTWLVDDGRVARGQWVLTDPLSANASGGSGTSLVAYPLERQGDGALALPDSDAPYLQPDRGTAYVDVANGQVVLGEEDVRYFLRASVEPGSGRVGELAITAVQASDEGEELPVPEDLEAAGDATSLWMSAGGDAVLVGGAGRAWIVTRDGSVTALDPTIVHGGFLREGSRSLPGCEGLESSILAAMPTRAGLRRAFGPADSIVRATEPNRHLPGATDSLFVVHYPGLVAYLRAPTGAADMVDRVDIMDTRYLRHARLGVGVPESEIVSVLGPPTARDSSELVYDCGVHVENPVTFRLAEGVVRSISIDYYLD